MSSLKPTQNSLRHNAKTSDESSIKEWEKSHIRVILPYLECILLDGYNKCKGYGLADYQKDLITLRKRYASEGFGFVVTSLPILFSGLCAYLEYGTVYYPSFALYKGAVHPRFLSGLFNILCDKNKLYDDREQAAAFECIYQLTQGFKKLDGPYPQKVLRQCMADFVRNDERIGKINYNDPAIRPIFEHARAIITSLFHKSKLKFLPNGELYLPRPRPGSGATATKVEKHMRYRPRMLYEQVNDIFDYDMFFNTTYQYIFGDTAVEHVSNLRDRNMVRTFPVSKFLFIPKVLKKPRGICEEENENQFMQQALRQLLYDHVSQSIWAGHVEFHDQTINRKLALSSSSTKSHATIDMSEASNCIPREGVLLLFRDTPLFDYLDAVSTRIIRLPDGLYDTRYYRANMYAPMGSGVCFPIMGIVHYALILGILATSTLPRVHETFSEVYVYGDDILLPTHVAELVCNRLPSFGMKVNVEKSFIHSHFRESCGCHAYKGYDITPAFFQKVPLETSTAADSSLLLSLLSKWRILKDKNYEETAQLLKSEINRIFGRLPEVHCNSALVGFPTYESLDLAAFKPFIYGRKCSKDDPQQWLVKVKLIIPRESEMHELSEHDAYLRSILEGTQGSVSQTKLGQLLKIAKTGYLHQSDFSADAKSDAKWMRSVRDYKIAYRWVPEPAIN